MADKQLTDAAWKAFAKGKGYKDAAFLKALAAVDKADKGGPEAMIEALEDVDKQLVALRKEHKGDKELGSYLDKVDAAAARERKSAETARSKAAAESSDEEEDSPALLTTRLVPLLKQVRKGDVVLQALIATTGKETAVMLSRKGIAPSRGKMMKEYLGVSGAIKFIKAECVFEANAHTFIVMSKAAGLAKTLKAALLAQTDMRVKVRVRGEDPDDIDDDGAEPEPEESDDRAHAGTGTGTGTGTATGKDTATGTGTATAPPTEAPPTGTVPPAPPPLSETYPQKRRQMQSAIDAGLTNPALAARVKALLEFAEKKAEDGNFMSAMQTLLTLEKALATAPVAAPAPAQAGGPGDPPGVDPGAAFNARLAGLMPRVKEALAAGGEAALNVKLKTSEAGVAARKRDFDAGHALLDEVEDLLLGRTAASRADTADAGSEPPPSGADPRQAEYNELVASLRKKHGAALAAPASDERGAALRAWDLATEAADAGNFERALLILRRLEGGGLLDRVAASAPQKASRKLVAQRNFLLTRWLAIPGELRAGLKTLQAGLEASGEDPDPEQLFDDVNDYIDDLLDRLQDRIDAAIQSGEAVGSTFERMLGEIQNEPVLTVLDSNPIDASVKFKQTVVDAVREIAAQFETA